MKVNRSATASQFIIFHKFKIISTNQRVCLFDFIQKLTILVLLTIFVFHEVAFEKSKASQR